MDRALASCNCCIFLQPPQTFRSPLYGMVWADIEGSHPCLLGRPPECWLASTPKFGICPCPLLAKAFYRAKVPRLCYSAAGGLPAPPQRSLHRWLCHGARWRRCRLDGHSHLCHLPIESWSLWVWVSRCALLPSVLLTDSLVSLRLLLSLERWPPARSLHCHDRREV